MELVNQVNFNYIHQLITLSVIPLSGHRCTKKAKLLVLNSSSALCNKFIKFFSVHILFQCFPNINKDIRNSFNMDLYYRSTEKYIIWNFAAVFILTYYWNQKSKDEKRKTKERSQEIEFQEIKTRDKMYLWLICKIVQEIEKALGGVIISGCLSNST